MPPDPSERTAREGLGPLAEGSLAGTPELPRATRAVTTTRRRAPRRGAQELGHVLGLHRRAGAVAAGSVLVLAALYLFTASPVYQASVVVQVEEGRTAGEPRQDLVALLEDRSAVSTEMELLRSRTLLEAVVVAEGLDLTVEPRYLPLVGRALARRHVGDAPAPAPLQLASFAWGGERIRIERLRVPAELLEAPLTLTALGGGRYRLETARRVLVEDGVVGAPAGPAKGADGIDVVVAELVARPGTRFDVVRRDPVAVASALARALVVQEGGPKGGTGVIEIALEGERPAEIARILNAVASTWVRTTTARRALANELAIEFLDTQLSRLRAGVRSSELTLEKQERVTSSPRLSRLSQAIASQITATEKEISGIEIQRTALAGRYGSTHPAVRAVEHQLEMLRAQRVALEQQLEGLPRSDLETAQLARDVKVTTGAYDAMRARAQELRLMQPGALESVRVVDPAVPPGTPLRPKPLLVLAGALLLSLIVGVGAAFASEALRDTIETPDDVERHTGLPVLLSIPHSPRQSRGARALAPGTPRLLATGSPTDTAVEGLRALRTALQFALSEGRGTVVAISSPAPRSGKSFVAANLAVLAAQAGRTVLLLDADLRRGGLHEAFDLPRAPGLTDVVSGAVALEVAARPTAVPGLDLVSTGPLPSNPSELLASKRFVQLVTAASRRYDLVLMDTAPLLAVADGALVAARAAVNLLVLRVHHETLGDVALAVEHLRLAGTSVSGTVLNDAHAARSSYKRYGSRYEGRSEQRVLPNELCARDAS